MPQMSPMWWELLFFMFMALYMIMNMIVYWMNNSKMISKHTTSMKIKENNWKF